MTNDHVLITFHRSKLLTIQLGNKSTAPESVVLVSFVNLNSRFFYGLVHYAKLYPQFKLNFYLNLLNSLANKSLKIMVLHCSNLLIDDQIIRTWYSKRERERDRFFYEIFLFFKTHFYMY